MEDEKVVEKVEDVVNVPSAVVSSEKKVRAARGELVRRAIEAGTGAPIAYSTKNKELSEIVSASQKVGAKTPHLFSKQATLEKARAVNSGA